MQGRIDWRCEQYGMQEGKFNKMNDLKCKIMELSESISDVSVMQNMIKQYEETYPFDLDLYQLKSICFLAQNKITEAYRLSREAVKRNPYNLEANIQMRNVLERMGEDVEALKYDIIAMTFQSLFQLNSGQESHQRELERKIEQKGAALAKSGTETKVREFREEVACLVRNMDSCFGFTDRYNNFGNQILGTYYENASGNRKYNACYNDIRAGAFEQIYNMSGDSTINKIESREVTETDVCVIGEDSEYILPVLSDQDNTEYVFATKTGDRVSCKSKIRNHFNYYRLPAGTRLESKHKLYIGTPVPLKQDPSLKKLVLNIFVDGLSQPVLEEEGLVNVMPHTAQFFSKGVVCSNVYTAGDWTLPSLASYVSGVATTRHHLIHPNLTYYLPKEITLLQEYFKEAGYQTAKIDGDWRSSQVYGYGRGMDRIIYQNQLIGMRAEQVIPDVLDHMELMKETNQFIWMCVGDLHDISDGFELKASVQASIPLALRGDEEEGATSVKQEYSVNKRMAYIRQMKHVDEYLSMLYRYIEANYRDQEIVISLFGDHGQGYLVKEEEHFLSQGRSKVGMMFRGDFKPEMQCDELISTCDYVAVMCKLAGIAMKEEQIDARLPVFFGGKKKRDYAITESIHPGDPYMAAIVSEEGVFYFTSEGKVEYDGRVVLGDYRYEMYDSQGMPCKKQDLLDKYLGIATEHIKEIIIY